MNVASLHIYPVKSLHGGAVPFADVAAPGLVGDRRWMVIQPDGRFRTFRETPRFADLRAESTGTGVRLVRRADGRAADIACPPDDAPLHEVSVFGATMPARDAGDAAAGFLREATGQDLRLAFMHDETVRPADPDFSGPGDVVSFADGFPLLLATQASLDALNGALAAPVEMRRFRPNIVVEGGAPWAEDHWRLVRIGPVTFRVVKPCTRCVMTTRDPDTGDQPEPAEPLRTLMRLHRSASGKPCFGQNLIPDGPGRVQVGDTVEVLETGPSNLA